MALASFEALECTPRAAADLALAAIARMDRDKGVVTARDIAPSYADAPRGHVRAQPVRRERSGAVPRRGDVAAASVPPDAELQLSARRGGTAHDGGERFPGRRGPAKGPVLTRARSRVCSRWVSWRHARGAGWRSRGGRFNPPRAVRGATSGVCRRGAFQTVSRHPVAHHRRGGGGGGGKTPAETGGAKGTARARGRANGHGVLDIY